jgi:hypothetical protein
VGRDIGFVTFKPCPAGIIGRGDCDFIDFIAAVSLTVLCAAAPARAEAVALVVGNERHDNLPAGEHLQKAVNDAHPVGGALRSIRVEVIEGEKAVPGRMDFFPPPLLVSSPRERQGMHTSLRM